MSEPFTYLSVCSGIEAATAAWHPLGWKPVAFSEIEAGPSAVLAAQYGSNMPDEPLSHNGVPNLGDMRKFKEWPEYAIRLLVGGTPCQSFSIAGLRAGLADPRGDLMLTYLAIAARYQPEWIVWENVPGVLSSNRGRDFGTFLGALGQLGYGFAYRVLDAQYCRAHGFLGAVPQRRRRVFVVANRRDWRRAAAVLFDAQSLRGDHPPRRDPKAQFAAVAGEGAARGRWPADVAPTLNAAFGDKQGLEDQHALGGAGLFIPEATNALTRHNGHRNEVADMVNGLIATPAYAQTLTRGAESGGKGGYAGRRQEDDQNRVVAFQPRFARNGRCAPAEVASALTSEAGRTGKGDSAQVAYREPEPPRWRVRRLMPVECCRLQGFPDDYLDGARLRGKPLSDGARYKALGNSMAVNVMRIIGERIAMVDAIEVAE